MATRLLKVHRFAGLAALRPAATAEHYARCRLLCSQPEAQRRKLQFSHWLEPCARPLSEDTLGTCIDNAAHKWGDRVGWAFMQEGRLCTYAEYKDQVDCLARGLLSAGFSKGDPLMIWSPSTFNWTLVAGAAAKAGVLSASTHFGLTPLEFEKCLTTVNFKGIYIPQPFKIFNYYEMLCSLIPELKDSPPGQLKYPSLKTVIIDSDQSVPGCVSLRDLMQGGEADLQTAQKNVTAGDPFTIVFTSGTTGVPKAAVLSHSNFINNVLMYDQRAKLTEETVMCNPLPFFHVYGLSVVLARTVVLGAKAVVPAPAYDAAAVLKAIQEHRCTELYGSPTMFVDIINSPLRKQFDISSLRQGQLSQTLRNLSWCTELYGSPTMFVDIINSPLRKQFDISSLRQGQLSQTLRNLSWCTELYGSPTMFVDIINSPLRKQFDISSLRQGESGGNVVTPAIRSLVREKLHVNVRVGFGTSELTTAAIVTGNDDPDDKQLNTVGRPLPGLEVKIVDPNTGTVLPVGTPGEVWGRGPNVFLGYYNDEQKTKEAMTPDGFYKTGDVGVMDDEGFVTIVSRLKDVIIGVPDERLGEEVCAWIVLKPDAKVTDGELKEHCKGKLSHFKIPRYFIYDAKVPKTPIGKPQKAQMRLLAAEKLGLAR
ncbi:hypothetical protein HPB50_026887 [Hyalomma asiaticum]|uniref:Uncharacterized protein n=1 Tax=Hyalomma asiaticum TaxID=266040 RepID=A0ACB7RXI8_HYAAI|nr:hypothetical protein HPB50_026887 [Hyalomma asiaticum]